LAALAAGNSALFEDFVTTEAGALLGFFRRLGAAPVEAEDLVQETVLKLFRGAKRYQPSGRFEAYAFRAARNVWIDSRRRAAVREHSSGADPDEGLQPVETVAGNEPEPFEGVEVAERSEELLRAVQSLDEGHRVAFELGVIQGLPYSEVAELLGVPIGTVKSRVFHAVKRLREDLGRAWNCHE
jgi:RNA polymerase sigma-70 factor (ECF subfamily)